MFKKQRQAYHRSNRDVAWLSTVLAIIVLIIVGRGVILVDAKNFDAIWGLFGPLATVLAALLVSSVASRLIRHSDVVRTDTMRRDTVRITHHLMAITKDLKEKVKCLRETIEGGTRPAIVVGKLVLAIESRYEALFEREAYLLLPGECIDTIIEMSGGVFGLGALAEGVNQVAAGKGMTPVGEVLTGDKAAAVTGYKQLEVEIDKLLVGIYAMRSALDPPAKSASTTFDRLKSLLGRRG